MTQPPAAETGTAAHGTRAAGIRADYDAVPAAVHRWIERELGSPVVSAVTQSGGFSPGAAARLVTASGRRAFVKAVGQQLNPDSPGLLRRERAAMEAMPALPWTPRLLATYDDGDWVALLLADIEGREPVHPWNRADTDRVFGALGDLTAALTPSPWPGAPAVDENAALGGDWARLREDPPDDLDPWARERLDRLAALAPRAQAAVRGDSLVHWDIRADNVLLTDDGGVVFVDWAWAARGAGWLDTTLACLDVVVSGSEVDVDELLLRHPRTRDTDPDDITAVIAAITGIFVGRSRAPAPPGLPTIRSYQRLVERALLGWIRQRFD